MRLAQRPSVQTTCRPVVSAPGFCSRHVAYSQHSQCADVGVLAVAERSSFHSVPRPSSRNTAVRTQAAARGFPFYEHEYHRVEFAGAPYGPLKIYQDPRNQGQFTGVMVFKQANENLSYNTKVMEVFVAGDTAVNIFTLVNNQKLDRPMVHDLMHTIMQHAQQASPRTMRLLRVAVVSLKDDVFIGRLFFGDPITQQVYWDCDCRPSDGCFLSIKCNAPLYINRSVWDMASKPISETTVHRMLIENERGGQVEQHPQTSSPSRQAGQPQQMPQPQATATAQADATPAPPSSDDYTVLMPDDLEAIKLLKRELSVAIQEEDYQCAIRIRDHPWMRLYREIHTNKMLGRPSDAARLQVELQQLIDHNTRSMSRRSEFY